MSPSHASSLPASNLLSQNLSAPLLDVERLRENRNINLRDFRAFFTSNSTVTGSGKSPCWA